MTIEMTLRVDNVPLSITEHLGALHNPMEVYEIFASTVGPTNLRNVTAVITDELHIVADLSTSSGTINVNDDPNEFMFAMGVNREMTFKDFDPVKIMTRLKVVTLAGGAADFDLILTIFARKIEAAPVPISTIRESLEDRKQVIDYRHSERDDPAIVAGEGGHQIRIRGRKQVGVEY